MVTTLRLVKKKDKSDRNGAKKRPRAGSIDGASAAAAANDPLKRLAAFRERMFDLKHDEKLSYSSNTNPEDAVVLAKLKKSKDGSASSSKKKRKTMSFGGGGDDDDDEVMPRIGVKKASALSTKKKEKKTVKSDVSSTSAVTVKSSTVKIPGGATNPVKKSAFGREGKLHSSSSKPAQVGSNFQKWQQQNSGASSSSAAVSAGKPKKQAISSSLPAASSTVETAASRSVSPTAVVTQDQLAMFEDVLSLEDPLEKAMQAVKERMVERSSSSSSKGKKKSQKKAKDEKKKSEKKEIVEVDEEKPTEKKDKKKQDKKKKAKKHEAQSTSEQVSVEEETQESAQAGEHASDFAPATSGSEVSPAAAATKKKNKKKEKKNSEVEEMFSPVQMDQFDAKQSEKSPHDAKSTDTFKTKATKRKRDDKQQESVTTSSTTAAAQQKTVETVAAAVVVDANPPTSTGDVANAAAPSAGLTAKQKKALKKKREKCKKAQRKASVSEADGAPAAATPLTALARTSLSSPAAPVQQSSSSETADNATSLRKEHEKEDRAPQAAPKIKKTIKTPDAKPTAQQQEQQEKQTKPAAPRDSKKSTKSASAKPTTAAKKDVLSIEASMSISSFNPVSVPSAKRQRVEKMAPKPTRPVSRVVEPKKKKSVPTVSTSHQQLLDLTSNEMNSGKSGDELDHNNESEEDESEDDFSDNNGSESTTSRQKQIFSNLIDEAARQQWDLLEVGRLVKLFAGQWGHKKKKTACFLCKFCPELVNVDFLEGLGVSLGPENLVKIFARGSGNAVVLMNKLASAIENGDLNVRDTAFLNVVAKQVRAMATNHEVLEFLVPLLESLSTVRDVSQLLKHICQHWHVDRTVSLVQQILLTAVFDDLDGNQDEILKDLPQLRKKLDFPSRLDQEDADENGNLKGLIANEDSDLGEESGGGSDYEAAEEALGEIHSEDEDEDHEDDESEDEEPYEGETDSEEEREALRAHHQQQRPKRRSRFILDEADEDNDFDEDDDDEEEELETEDEGEHGFGAGAGRGIAHARGSGNGGDDSSSSSSSDSEDETWRSKPKS